MEAPASKHEERRIEGRLYGRTAADITGPLQPSGHRSSSSRFCRAASRSRCSPWGGCTSASPSRWPCSSSCPAICRTCRTARSIATFSIIGLVVIVALQLLVGLRTLTIAFHAARMRDPIPMTSPTRPARRGADNDRAEQGAGRDGHGDPARHARDPPRRPARRLAARRGQRPLRRVALRGDRRPLLQPQGRRRSGTPRAGRTEPRPSTATTTAGVSMHEHELRRRRPDGPRPRPVAQLPRADARLLRRSRHRLRGCAAGVRQSRRVVRGTRVGAARLPVPRDHPARRQREPAPRC